MHNLPSKYCKTSCFFDDQAKTVTAWLGSTDSSTVFTSHCTFGFLCILVFTKFFNGKNFSSREDYISVLVAQLCLTLCDPMDCNPPGSSLHEIFQARILGWVAISFSRGSSQLRDRIRVSCTAGRFFTDWATREAQYPRRWVQKNSAAIYAKGYQPCFLLGM